MRADIAWLKAYYDCENYGEHSSPRGKPIKELMHRTLVVDLDHALVTVPERKLNYRFAMAEALWMCTGRNDVQFLAEYNPNMRQFSDDGVTLTGAYGPNILMQLDYVINKLIEDNDTRQATLTTWRPYPAPSKDIPCTVAMDFKLRQGRLNMHVFMRSSDVWLGVPYDLFSFSCIAHLLAGHLFNRGGLITKPGKLYLTAASSHVYEPHYGMLVGLSMPPITSLKSMPAEWWGNTAALIAGLDALKDTRKGDALRWWE